LQCVPSVPACQGRRRDVQWQSERVAVVCSPFRPGDSLRLYRLQRRGVSLDLQRELTQPPMPLWEAWLAYLTQQAMGRPTYVLDDPHHGEAVVQIRYRPHQAAADVAFLAPELADDRRAASAWSRLLDGACIEAASRGIQRVFASLPETGGAVDLFHQAGFVLYAADEIYRLDQISSSVSAAPAVHVRAQRPEDWPALQRLCVAVTPQRVRQVEGGILMAVDDGWSHHRFVAEGEGPDELTGALSVYTGSLAHWLRILVSPAAPQAAESLLRWGLHRVAEQAGKPVYVNIRKYEGGVLSALASAGFELYAVRSLMVKPTVAWVKATVQELVPALKGTVEPVPPAFHVHRGVEGGSGASLAADRQVRTTADSHWSRT